MKHSIEDEVNRLIGQAASPNLRLPRSIPEMHMLLMDSRGAGMSREETRLGEAASKLGGARLKVEFEDALLAGAEIEELQALLEVAADAIVEALGKEGPEVARILGDRARRDR